MAVSGSYDFSLDRNEIIKGALRLLGVLGFGETPSADEITDASEALNLMIKSWQAESVGLWLNKQITLYMKDNTQAYSLGATGDNATLTPYHTHIATAAASGATSLSVDAITSMTASDKIGIELDDGTLQWTTISGTPSGTTVNLAAALTDTAAVDNIVFFYTTISQRPLEIIEARVHDKNDEDITLSIITRTEYMNIVDKDSEGTPNQIYYDPQLTNGKLYVWPSPDDVSDVIILTGKYPIDDFDASTNDACFPQEWHEALKYNLAVRLAPEYMSSHLRYDNIPPIDPNQISLIIQMANELKTNAKRFDVETSLYFKPDLREY